MAIPRRVDIPVIRIQSITLEIAVLGMLIIPEIVLLLDRMVQITGLPMVGSRNTSKTLTKVKQKSSTRRTRNPRLVRVDGVRIPRKYDS